MCSFGHALMLGCVAAEQGVSGKCGVAEKFGDHQPGYTMTGWHGACWPKDQKNRAKVILADHGFLGRTNLA